MTELAALLEKGLVALNIQSTEQQRDQWLSFLLLLEKWNKAFNLTAVRDPRQMISRHILESLTIAPFVVGERILDVGTGAGLPGIPLAIFYPKKCFYLLDSNQKKQIFVGQAIKTLGLTQATAVHSLVQKYQPEQKFSTILTRAFAPLTKTLPLVSPLLAREGRLLAMLGKEQPELAADEPFKIERLVALFVPGEQTQRQLAIISKLTA